MLCFTYDPCPNIQGQGHCTYVHFVRQMRLRFLCFLNNSLTPSPISIIFGHNVCLGMLLCFTYDPRPNIQGQGHCGLMFTLFVRQMRLSFVCFLNNSLTPSPMSITFGHTVCLGILLSFTYDPRPNFQSHCWLMLYFTSKAKCGGIRVLWTHFLVYTYTYASYYVGQSTQNVAGESGQHGRNSRWPPNSSFPMSHIMLSATYILEYFNTIYHIHLTRRPIESSFT